MLDPLQQLMSEAIDPILASTPLEVLREASAAQTGAGSLATLVSFLPRRIRLLPARIQKPPQWPARAQ